MVSNGKTFETAVKRWEGVGPYYAMFPTRFADAIVRKHTSHGDMILDPFAGRGTAVFSAAAAGRRGIGIEISPVGWVYAKAKLNPAPIERIEKRLVEVAEEAKSYVKHAQSLPVFFRKCYSPEIQCFLLAARAGLDWRRRKCDWTLMAFLLVYLHGKEGQALSNQMRQTKAMSPHYAIRWWEENGTKPPVLDIVEFLRKRIRWRYAKGIVQANDSQILLGNSVALLPRLERRLCERGISKPTLLLTSPPYFGVTNYHYDQWLRLWLLGFETDAYVARGPHRGRFTSRTRYRDLLTSVFRRAARLVNDKAVVYVRTSKDLFTKEATLYALRQAFPQKCVTERYRPFRKPTQTHLFGDKTPKSGEVDLVLEPTALG